jgi:hypothetical protein
MRMKIRALPRAKGAVPPKERERVAREARKREQDLERRVSGR